MKYDNIRAFEKHLGGAAPHHFSPLYLILGKDNQECKEAIDLVLHFLLPIPTEREFALRVIEGAHVEIEDLLTDLHSQSFFATKRMIWIQQADKLKKSVIEALEKYLKHIHRSQFILLSASSLAKNTSFYKIIEKEGVVLELLELKPWEKEKRLVEWVNKQVTASRKIISYQACQALVKCIGTDSSLLAQELEKLFCYVGDKNEITVQDIAKICTYLHVDTIWQLGEAIFRRDAATALTISQSILQEGQSLLPLLRQIRSQFQTEFQICTLLQAGKQTQEIVQEFPYMKGQILERHLHLAQHYGYEAFKKGLLAIDATEMRVKNSSVEEQLLAELLMIQLTHTR